MSIHGQITEALTGWADQYDINAIAAACAEADIDDIDDIDDDAFAALIEPHLLPEPTAPLDEFVAGMTAAIEQCGPSETAAWDGAGVRVEVDGASRVNHAWPQPWARLAIITPDGTRRDIRGEDVHSWESLWADVDAAAVTWRESADEALAYVLETHRDLERAEALVTQARNERNRRFRDASRLGISAYRMAKTIGVAESTVGRVLKPSRGGRPRAGGATTPIPTERIRP